MNTLKFWLVANFGVVISIFSITIATITAMGIEPPQHLEKTDFIGIIVFAAVFFSLLLCFPSKKMNETVGRYLAIVFFGFLLLFYKEEISQDPHYYTILTLYLIAFVCGTVVAGFLAYYVFHNFDEVVSRRMLYRNSAVGLFDNQVKYTIGQFMNISSAVFGGVLVSVGLPMYIKIVISQ